MEDSGVEARIKEGKENEEEVCCIGRDALDSSLKSVDE